MIISQSSWERWREHSLLQFKTDIISLSLHEEDAKKQIKDIYCTERIHLFLSLLKRTLDSHFSEIQLTVDKNFS